MNLQEMLIEGSDNATGFPYAGVIRVRFSGYDLSLLLQAPPTMGCVLICSKDNG